MPTPALRRVLPLAACAVLLAACNQAPVLQVPQLAVPAGFKEVAPWVPAQPADHLPRGDWWAMLGDAELNALQQRLLAGSPDLAAALARYQQAQAVTDQLRAAQLPNINASLVDQRNRQSEKRPLRVLGPLSPNEYGSHTLGVAMDYELDLWGRVRSQVEAGTALEQAAQADLAAARLALQAQLADSLLALRGLDRDAALLADTEAALGKALAMVRQRHEAGIASGLDVARAEAQLESVRSQRQQSVGQRALIEHAVAALVGEAASGFSLAAAPQPVAAPPEVPLGLPSTLLQRRPDVAAAERRVAAANASVGVARAAVFPAVTLGSVLGYQSNQFGHLITAPNMFWTVGPSLVVNLFDGGRRQAEIARTQAVLDENGARYKAVVLGAFAQVEDNLALLRQYAQAAQAEQAALAANQRALALANSRYREGAASYLEVITAQTAALQSQRSVQDLATRRQRTTVQLIRALGGGWSTAAGGAP